MLSDKLRDIKANNDSNPVTKMGRDELKNIMGGVNDPKDTTIVASGPPCGTSTCVCLNCPEEPIED